MAITSPAEKAEVLLDVFGKSWYSESALDTADKSDAETDSRICRKCGLTYPAAMFNWKIKARGIRQNACRNCTAAVSSKHYQENKADYKARAKAHNNKQRAFFQEALVTYLLEHPCVDCGEADPVLLEFDHRHDETKCFNVGTCSSSVNTWVGVEKEIAKCDVRCVRCHRLKTARERGWYRYLHTR